MAKSVAYANLVLGNRLPYCSASSLQTRMYQMGKKEYGFNAQVICEIIRTIANSKGERVNGIITVKFNIPRNCKTFRTKGIFFVELSGLRQRCNKKNRF
ncbi:MAG: hypothetical protein QXG05_06250 [Nitrososphaerota archaeon]